MREHHSSSHAAGAPTGITRRRLLARTAAGALAVTGLDATGATARIAAAAHDAWWTRARAIADSGALGPIRWVEARYQAAPGQGAGWTPLVPPILAAIGAPATPRRTSTLGSGAPTVVLEFDAAPPVFLAPARERGGRASVVVRGTRASLLLRNGELWLQPESPGAAARPV